MTATSGTPTSAPTWSPKRSFVGQAKITSVVTAGYLLEIGTGAPEIDRNNANNDDVATNVFTVRHSAW